MKRRGNAFTLVELLVVIAIIGILTTLAVIGLSSVRQKSRDTKRVNSMKAVAEAMELIFTEKGNFNDLGCTGGEVYACTGGDLEQKIANLNNIKDPGNPASFCNSGGGAGDCATENCEFFFDQVTGDEYSLLFHLEGPVAGTQFDSAGCWEMMAGGVFTKYNY